MARLTTRARTGDYISHLSGIRRFTSTSLWLQCYLVTNSPASIDISSNNFQPVPDLSPGFVPSKFRERCQRIIPKIDKVYPVTQSSTSADS